MLRIHYVANVRLPSERANAYQILAQCDALTSRGHDLTILAPRRRNRFQPAEGSVRQHFVLRAEPRIERVFSLDTIDLFPTSLQRNPFILQSFTFSVALRTVLQREKARLIYSRDPWSLYFLTRKQDALRKLFYEVHDLPERPDAQRRLVDTLSRCDGVVAITQGLREDLISLGVRESAIHVLADGYDPERFRDLPSPEEARKQLGLKSSRKYAVYTGHLFPWKGVDVLVEAAASSDRFHLLLVGGREEDRKRIAGLIEKLGASNVSLIEPVPPRDVPVYLAAADVLVLPNSARLRISERYTSPLKLFEYMASGTPIVSSDLPSLREVLGDDTGLFVPPDDSAALCKGIERCLDDTSSAARASRALEEVKKYTWDRRAEALESILDPGKES